MCSDMKGDYLTSAEMNSDESHDGLLVTLVHRVMKGVPRQSISFQESNRIVAFLTKARPGLPRPI